MDVGVRVGVARPAGAEHHRHVVLLSGDAEVLFDGGGAVAQQIDDGRVDAEVRAVLEGHVGVVGAGLLECRGHVVFHVARREQREVNDRNGRD